MKFLSKFRGGKRNINDQKQEKSSTEKKWSVHSRGVEHSQTTNYLSRENSAQSVETVPSTTFATTSTTTTEAVTTSGPTGNVKISQSENTQLQKSAKKGGRSSSISNTISSLLHQSHTKIPHFLCLILLSLGLFFGPAIAMAIYKLSAILAFTAIIYFVCQSTQAIVVSQHRTQEHLHQSDNETQVQFHKTEMEARTRVMLHVVEKGQMGMLKGSMGEFLGVGVQGDGGFGGERGARRRMIMDA